MPKPNEGQDRDRQTETGRAGQRQTRKDTPTGRHKRITWETQRGTQERTTASPTYDWSRFVSHLTILAPSMGDTQGRPKPIRWRHCCLFVPQDKSLECGWAQKRTSTKAAQKGSIEEAKGGQSRAKGGATERQQRGQGKATNAKGKDRHRRGKGRTHEPKARHWTDTGKAEGRHRTDMREDKGRCLGLGCGQGTAPWARSLLQLRFEFLIKVLKTPYEGPY